MRLTGPQTACWGLWGGGFSSASHRGLFQVFLGGGVGDRKYYYLAVNCRSLCLGRKRAKTVIRQQRPAIYGTRVEKEPLRCHQASVAQVNVPTEHYRAPSKVFWLTYRLIT
ncbi:hypothetical protein GE21DRAFT_1270144 [Neurospora crassa]|nr:hypothetical protein GE21DRAFT_1270144 [Neurospora crassa]